MAEANQKQYREIRALGKKATPDQIDRIQKESSGAARRAYLQEKTEQRNVWKQAIKKIFGGTKEQTAALWGLDPKTGKPIERKPGDAPAPGGAVKPSQSSSRPTITKTGGPLPTTGQSEGTGTAQSVEYGSPKKPDSNIKVEDGIIQDR